MAKTPTPRSPTLTTAEIVAQARALRRPARPAVDLAAVNMRQAVAKPDAAQTARLAKLLKSLGA
ncbi:MAG TPA: hypothetical protein VND96_12250 [Candidatus Micrarchaeaceae archaeon]|nr:hypothetical protein [Candidatus Micrarchaeaceae archaeon]